MLSWSENISVPIHPGYTALPEGVPGHMLITSFEATPFFGKNALYMYDLAKGKGAGVQMLPGSDQMNWPNAITGLPASVFGFPAVVVGSGFLVPSHTTGAVWVFEAAADPKHLTGPVKITKDKAGRLPDSGWFYHMAVPLDMNGDGRLDLLTARCEFGVWPWSSKQGELIWLEQPATAPLSGEPWAEHRLAGGPDFLFAVQPGAAELAVAAAEFIGERVAYYYMRNGTLRTRVIDATSGPGFGCSWADLNGDGRLELLATNHVNQNGAVYAYSFDGDDFATAAVTRHVIASGFSAATTKTGTASPGDAIAFFPKRGDAGKPHIFLSGDNSNSIFLLVPKSQDPADWSYTVVPVAYLGADVGRASIGDTDGDGFADLFVPAFDNNVLVHYKFGASVESHEVLV